MKKSKISPASFRDPSGFIYQKDGTLYRQINLVYKDNFDLFVKSGLCDKLQKEQLLIPHRQINISFAHDQQAYKVIRPEIVPFISYPYGWSFSMLKDAALLTLGIQKIALEHDMSLKDASAFNIQFQDGHPVFIDTLSFEKYQPGLPWVAYRQFCQHFLGPLSLMAHTDIRLNQLIKVYIDGIPLDLASKLLPSRTYLNFLLLTHIHLHAKSQQQWADKQFNVKKRNLNISKIQLTAVIDSLYSGISKIKLPQATTEWGDYYNFTNYNNKSFKSKGAIVKKLIQKCRPKTVWDLGANNGYFSRIAADFGAYTVAFDIDPIAVEKNYLQIKQHKDKNILPLIIDLTNPTSDYGWSNEERDSLVKRGPADTIMALALIHHLAIGNNLPFDKIADFLSRICHHLIIEFVPKEDSQVQKLLASREDIFTQYNETEFEKTFTKYFKIISKTKVENSLRTIYLFYSK